MAARNGKRAGDQGHVVDPGGLSTGKGTTTLKKRSHKRGIDGKRSRKEQANGRAEEEWTLPLMLDREELVAMLEDRLTEFATDVGLQVACLLFRPAGEYELQACDFGPKQTQTSPV